ncbi:hypothetical protein K8R20_02500 [bacterium]|nr:hypothetical protein [bacterium]
MIIELGLIKLGLCLEAFFYATIALAGIKRGGKLGESMYKIGLISLVLLLGCFAVGEIISSGSWISYILIGALLYKAVMGVVLAWVWLKKF